jgi:hypothetical protein
MSGYFMQQNALAHAINMLVLALDKVFGELPDCGLLDLRI